MKCHGGCGREIGNKYYCSKCIEKCYWHLKKIQKEKGPIWTKQKEEARQKKPYKGWKVLILWEDELTNLKKIQDKLLRFVL